MLLVEAALARKAARQSNPHVEAFLTGARKVPRELLSFYGFGDENEAPVCMHEIGGAWRAHPKAIAWLKQRSSKR